MKTNRILLRTLLLFPFLFAMVNCGSNNNSTPANPVGTTGYYMSNGTCYAPGGQPVTPTYCSQSNLGGNYMANGMCYNSAGVPIASGTCPATTGTSGYYYSNGICYSSMGQQMPANYCSGATGVGTGTGMGTGYLSQQCVGNYIYTGQGAPQLVYCNGANCKGVTMYTYPGQQPVLCQ